ncbi:MAG TPA: hypothetical protein VLI54_02830 [Bacillota bacterium]|nr:hypothetical protein [Bacillota bacterium]
MATVSQIVDRHRSQYHKPGTEMRGGIRTEIYEGHLLETVIADLVGYTTQQMSRRSNAPGENITRFLLSRGYRCNSDGRYSTDAWKAVSEHFRPAPYNYTPVAELPDTHSPDEWTAMAHALGVAVENYYTIGGHSMPHIGPSGVALLYVQLTV